MEICGESGNIASALTEIKCSDSGSSIFIITRVSLHPLARKMPQLQRESGKRGQFSLTTVEACFLVAQICSTN